MGGVVRRYIDFLITLLIPTPLVSAPFLQQHPYFFVYLNVFSFFNNKNKKEGECQIAIFNFTWCVRKLRYYGNVIHSLDWKSAVEHDGSV